MKYIPVLSFLLLLSCEIFDPGTREKRFIELDTTSFEAEKYDSVAVVSIADGDTTRLYTWRRGDDFQSKIYLQDGHPEAFLLHVIGYELEGRVGFARQATVRPESREQALITKDVRKDYNDHQFFILDFSNRLVPEGDSLEVEPRYNLGQATWYQWYKADTLYTTAPSLLFNPALFTDSGQYFLRAGTKSDTARSNTFRITVVDSAEAVVLVKDLPPTLDLLEGDSLILEVGVTGDVSDWAVFKDGEEASRGVLLPDTSNEVAWFIIPEVAPEDAGGYRFAVTSGSGDTLWTGVLILTINNIGIRITSDATGGGSVSPAEEFLIPNGGTATFTITPEEGHFLDFILSEGDTIRTTDSVWTSPVIEFQDPSPPLERHFFFHFERKLIQVNLTVNDTGFGGAVITTEAPYLYGDTIQLIATPHENYRFMGFVFDDTTIVEDTAYIRLEKDLNISARFSLEETFRVTVDATPGGTAAVAPETSSGYFQGDTVVFTATPDPYFEFDHWSDGGTDSSFEYIVSGDTSFTAYFKRKTHNLALIENVDGGDQLADDSAGLFPAGVPIRIYTHTNSTHLFSHWTVTDGEVEIADSLSDTTTVTLSGDTEVMAVYEEKVKLPGIIISPEYTRFNGSLKVSLSLDTSSPGDLPVDSIRILYTTNGQEPDENSSVYFSPIEITQNAFVKARAILNQNYLNGDLTQKQYLKNTPPTLSVDEPALQQGLYAVVTEASPLIQATVADDTIGVTLTAATALGTVSAAMEENVGTVAPLLSPYKWNTVVLAATDLDGAQALDTLVLYHAPALPSITSFSVDTVDFRFVGLSWAPVPNTHGYILYRGPAADSLAVLDTLSGTSYTDSTAMPSREYHYALRGYYRLADTLSFADSTNLSPVLSATTKAIFQKRYAPTGVNEGVKLFQLADGSYIQIGMTYSKARDVFIRKTDAVGNELWTGTYGSSDEDIPLDAAMTLDGGFIVCGYQFSNQQAFLLKLSANGDSTWFRTYGGSGSERAHSVVETNGGGYTVVGETSSSGAGGSDFWFLQVDASGDSLREQVYGGTLSDVGRDVIKFSNGFVAVGDSAGSSHVWLLSLNPFGQINWQSTHSQGSRGEALVRTLDGGYMITGRTNSFGPSGSNLLALKTDGNGVFTGAWAFGTAGDDIGNDVVETAAGDFLFAGMANNDLYLLKTAPDGTEMWSGIYDVTADDALFSIMEDLDGGVSLFGTANRFGSSEQVFIKTDPEGYFE